MIKDYLLKKKIIPSDFLDNIFIIKLDISSNKIYIKLDYAYFF